MQRHLCLKVTRITVRQHTKELPHCNWLVCDDLLTDVKAKCAIAQKAVECIDTLKSRHMHGKYRAA